MDPDNPWIAQSMNPCLICTLHGQFMDWTNLAQSVDHATMHSIRIRITFDSQLAGQA